MEEKLLKRYLIILGILIICAIILWLAEGTKESHQGNVILAKMEADIRDFGMHSVSHDSE